MKNSWERRFFVLASTGMLYWFKEGKAKEAALGCIQVGGDAGPCRLQPLGVKLSFELATPKKAYVSPAPPPHTSHLHLPWRHVPPRAPP